MSKQLSYITIDGLMNKLARNLPSTFKYDEDDVIEWAGEALAGVGAYNELVERIYFLQVANYKCNIPPNSKYIIQIALNNSITNMNYRQNLCAINDALKTDVVDNEVNYVLLDCKGTPVTDYDVAYYRPFFSLEMDYGKWASSNHYRKHWSTITPSQNSFFDICNKDDRHDYLYNYSKNEYRIEAPFIKFSFKEGVVALAVSSIKLDDIGYPMIPDNYTY